MRLSMRTDAPVQLAWLPPDTTCLHVGSAIVLACVSTRACWLYAVCAVMPWHAYGMRRVCIGMHWHAYRAVLQTHMHKLHHLAQQAVQ